MGDGIGHVAVTGVALGLITGTSPTWTAVVVAALGAIAIELIRSRGHTNGDVALALMFYGGLAGGVLLTGLGGQSTSLLQTYLFGSITTISPTDVWVTIALAAVVIAVCVGLSPQLFAVSHDPEFARVAGLRVTAYNLAIAVLAAVSVTVAMRTVGLLLVSALMVVPVATVPAARPVVPDHAGRGDAARHRRVGRRPAARGVRVVLRQRGPRPDHRAAVAGRLRRGVAARGVAAVAAAAARAVRAGRPRGPRASSRSTGTCTARTAATWPSSTATTSTTCTTATATRPTESTMTSTDGSGPRAHQAAAGRARGAGVGRRLPLGPGGARDPRRRRGRPVGLATVYRTLQLYADHGDVDVLRREDGEAIYRRCSETHHHHLVCRSCGATVEVEGPAVERWTTSMAAEHGFTDRQPHPRDLRYLRRLLAEQPPLGESSPVPSSNG